MEERGWSYADLARRSGHALTRGRWQQLGSGAPSKKFPDPASLSAIAQVLEVDITAVVLAAARAVGLDARLEGSSLANYLPAGTSDLSDRMRDAILQLIRAAVTDTVAVHDGADVAGENAMTLEWPKSAAPSRRNPNGQAERSGFDAQ
jgi:transcriptional regulator with XRE-family HTH domain